MKKNPIIGVIKTRLRIFDPIILPITIPFCLFLSAEMLVANSGRLVPNASNVRPIIKSGTPKIIAVFFRISYS